MYYIVDEYNIVVEESDIPIEITDDGLKVTDAYGGITFFTDTNLKIIESTGLTIGEPL